MRFSKEKFWTIQVISKWKIWKKKLICILKERKTILKKFIKISKHFNFVIANSFWSYALKSLVIGLFKTQQGLSTKVLTCQLHLITQICSKSCNTQGDTYHTFAMQLNIGKDPVSQAWVFEYSVTATIYTCCNTFFFDMHTAMKLNKTFQI